MPFKRSAVLVFIFCILNKGNLQQTAINQTIKSYPTGTGTPFSSTKEYVHASGNERWTRSYWYTVTSNADEVTSATPSEKNAEYDAVNERFTESSEISSTEMSKDSTVTEYYGSSVTGTYGNDVANGSVTESPNTDDPYWLDISNKVDIFFTAINTPLGTLGNILSFGVYLRQNSRAKSLSVYLSALAVTDTITLWWDPSIRWFELSYGILLPTKHCALRYWINYSACTNSAYLVVAITVERFIAVFYPFKSISLLTIKRARITAICLAVGCLLLYAPLIVSVTENCDPQQGFGEFYMNIFFIMAFVIFLMVPSVTLFVLSISIICMLRSNNLTKMAAGEVFQEIRSKEVRKVTRVVLCISCSYLVLTLPYITYLNYSQISIGLGWTSGILGDWDKFIDRVLVNLLAVNYSINFWLYVMASNSFRQELVDMLRLRRCFRGGQNPQVFQLKPD